MLPRQDDAKCSVGQELSAHHTLSGHRQDHDRLEEHDQPFAFAAFSTTDVLGVSLHCSVDSLSS